MWDRDLNSLYVVLEYHYYIYPEAGFLFLLFLFFIFIINFILFNNNNNNNNLENNYKKLTK